MKSLPWPAQIECQNYPNPFIIGGSPYRHGHPHTFLKPPKLQIKKIFVFIWKHFWNAPSEGKLASSRPGSARLENT